MEEPGRFALVEVVVRRSVPLLRGFRRLTPLLVVALMTSVSRARGEEAVCTGLLVPPNVAIYREPQANAIYSVQRSGWTVAIPDSSRMGYKKDDVKLDPTGGGASWRGSCRDADAERRAGYVRAWLIASMPQYGPVWIQESDVLRFRYGSPGDWDGQNSARNSGVIKAAGMKAIGAETAGVEAADAPRTIGREGKTFPLRFTPTDDIQGARPRIPGTLLTTPIRLEVLADARPGDRTRIAENREGSVPVIMRTTSDVADFVSQGMKKCFGSWGGVEAGAGGKAVRGELVRLFVEETGRYRADVQVRFSILDGAGKVLWQGVVIGKADKYGRSKKPENYVEVISDAVINLTAVLLGDPGFQAAWGGVDRSTSVVKRPEAAAHRAIPPEAAKAEVLTLLKGGFEEAALIEFVKGIVLTRQLGAGELVEWKAAGIPEKVIVVLLSAR